MRTEPAKNIQGLFEGSLPWPRRPKKNSWAERRRQKCSRESVATQRNHGGGRSLKCPEIGYELFQWFVDTIRLVKACVGNDILMAKAKQVLHDAEVSVQELLAVGRITEDPVPSWPKIGK